MKTTLIILDGAKGAGKSTTSRLLAGELQHTVFLSLDQMRGLIPNAKKNDKYNQMAFDVLSEMIDTFLYNSINVVLDAGLIDGRVAVLEDIARVHGAGVLKVHLAARKETLWGRVLKRDKERGKDSDRVRFDYTFAAQRNKDFKGFLELDTSVLSPEEIVSKIVTSLRRPSR